MGEGVYIMHPTMHLTMHTIHPIMRTTPLLHHTMPRFMHTTHRIMRTTPLPHHTMPLTMPIMPLSMRIMHHPHTMPHRLHTMPHLQPHSVEIVYVMVPKHVMYVQVIVVFVHLLQVLLRQPTR